MLATRPHTKGKHDVSLSIHSSLLSPLPPTPMNIKTEHKDPRLIEPSSVMRVSPSQSPRQLPQACKSPRQLTGEDSEHDSTAANSSASSRLHEAKQIDCQICRVTVSFEDHATGQPTLKYWEQHNARCTGIILRPTNIRFSSPAQRRSQTVTAPSPQSPNENSVSSTPVDTSKDLASPTEVTHVIQGKRRRAKRTEEERIEYLANDPYISQYEAYRVLCGSCQKWIRLRPNSTYCSIPWDAHRKSCLAKKFVSNDGEEAVIRRNALLERDPNIRKFDVERVLCAICDLWISVQPTSYQAWLDHREKCSSVLACSSKSPLEGRDPPFTNARMSPEAVDPVSLPPASRQSQALLSHVPTRQVSASSHTPPRSSGEDADTQRRPDTADSARSSDSRRRNESQRAAVLRSDPFIKVVEPGRVFCSLCQKWVQLRQDSTYCAYPWHQHRAKCLARHDKRRRKEGESPKRSEYPSPETPVRMRSPSWFGHSEEPRQGSSSYRYADDEEDEPPRKRVKACRSDDEVHSTEKTHWTLERRVSNVRAQRHEANTDEEQRRDTSLDLRSDSGRSTFIMWSISHLFQTTYNPLADELSVSALLTYLNAALPPDKYEEFDFREVVKTVDTLSRDRKSRETERLKLSGDMIRWV